MQHNKAQTGRSGGKKKKKKIQGWVPRSHDLSSFTQWQRSPIWYQHLSKSYLLSSRRRKDTSTRVSCRCRGHRTTTWFEKYTKKLLQGVCCVTSSTPLLEQAVFGPPHTGACMQIHIHFSNLSTAAQAHKCSHLNQAGWLQPLLKSRVFVKYLHVFLQSCKLSRYYRRAWPYSRPSVSSS